MDNIAEILESQLDQPLLSYLRRMAEACERRGCELYLVGGVVRDMLLERPSGDIDVSVVGSEAGFDSEVAAELGGEVIASSEFGTSKLKIGEAVIDLVNARRESYECPGALPTVESGTIEDDLARRDFSINAMAVALRAPNRSWGDLLDPFDGLGDLERGVIKVLHENSFVDDATRILRGVRYAGRFDFQFDDKTLNYLRRDLPYINTIKGDRIRHEFERIFDENKAFDILRLARDLSVLSAVYRPLNPDDSILSRLGGVDPSRQTERDLFYISLLAYSLQPSQLEGFITRLNMNAEWASAIRDTGAVKTILNRLKSEGIENSQIYDLLNPYKEIAIKACALVSDNTLLSERLNRFLDKLRHVRPILNGDDLMEMGIPQGPNIGVLLRELLVERLNARIAERQDEEAYVHHRIESGPEVIE